MHFEHRKLLLDAAKNLNSSNKFKHVFINRDLTWTQRQQLYERRTSHRTYLNQTNRSPVPSRDPPVILTGANASPVANRLTNGQTSQPSLLSIDPQSPPARQVTFVKTKPKPSPQLPVLQTTYKLETFEPVHLQLIPTNQPGP